MLAQSSLRAVLSTKGGFLFVEQSQEEIELRLLLTEGMMAVVVTMTTAITMMRTLWRRTRTNKEVVDQSQEEIELELFLTEGLVGYGHRFEGRARDN